MPNYNPLSAIAPEERLSFAQNFDVKRPTVLDVIFPDVKTQFWTAEYFRLMSGSQLPDVAFVHGLDTEAEIGQRPSFEKVLTEKLFIKRKLNQSESLQHAIDHGVPDNDALLKYVFDDASTLFEGVLARTKIMKGQAMATGALKIKENGIDMTIDFGVPSANKKTLAQWSSASSDILGDIETMIAALEAQGYVANHLLTSKKNVNYMRNNTAIQTAILGAANKRLLSKSELADFMMSEYGVTIDVCEEKYRYKKADGTFATGRYYAENKVTMYEADANGSFGTGLWGPTPEEGAYGPYSEKSNRQFITLSMWETADPVAKWTKASGMFVPVMPKANGIVIGTVTP